MQSNENLIGGTPLKPKNGYHNESIPKGSPGEISKIYEELLELQDAKKQGVLIMELVELSDLYGAIKLYLKKYHPNVSMKDLEDMANLTESAFLSGKRK